ncbi:hypothetical protein Prum_012450 [Phytohabitans rumicis]|uniref:LamG-like jellyroll fold domain-containing protein n=2 Tax=Phytohabitans rumicis TaxID=1076125 RepID=A0A6V8KR20_9ACTN|nr:hypothetical protein Prum_012450 [Phytohabitans rumicis]
MLADPATVFPVFVDPTWTQKTVNRSAWSVLRWSEASKSFYKASSVNSSDANYGMMRAGFSDWESPTVKDRSLFAFDIAPYKFKHIYKATMSLTQMWSGAGCSYAGTARTELRWLKQAFGPSTTWNTGWNTSGSGWGEVLATSDVIRRNGYSCSPSKVEFNVTGKVAQLAASGTGVLNVGLRAKSESDRFQWKRFKSDAALSIHYNTKPNAARDLKVAAKGCATGTARPFVTTNAPTFTATASDPDSGQQALTTRFYYWKQGQARNTAIYVQGTSANPAPVTSGPVSTTDAVKKLVENTVYVYQAYTFDNVNDGTWSGTCEFHTDFLPPNPASDITSTDGLYPEYNPANPNQPGSGGVGFAGGFRIHPPTTMPEDVVYYRWTIDQGVSPGNANKVTPDASKNAYISVRPRRDGVHTLTVWAEDRAERPSTPIEYKFKVASGSGPATEWNFDDATNRGLDDTGHGNTLTLSSAGTTTGRGGEGTALSLTSATAHALTTGPVTQPHPTTGAPAALRTDSTFTVAAWVRLASPSAGAGQTAVAADGATNSAFTLSYTSAQSGRWRFVMVSTDTSGSGTATVLSDSTAVLGKWTHLAGTFDAATKTLRLYVNGVQQSGSAVLSGGFHATGPVTIGRSRWTALNVDYLKGAIDDVRMYNFIPSPAAIKDLARPVKPQVAFTTATVTVGSPAQVTFNAGGDTNITKFKYSIGTDTLNLTADPATPGGTTTPPVAIPTTQTGQLRVWVAAFNQADNLLGESVSATIQVEAATVGLSGRTFDQARQPLAGATVILEPPGLTVTSGADGAFAFTGLTPGTYVVAASHGGGCGLSASTEVKIPDDGDPELFLVPPVDSYGYGCQVDARAFTPADDTVLQALAGADNAVTQVSLPFEFPFYGDVFDTVWVDTNGLLTFTEPGGSTPGRSMTIPAASAPNGLVAAFWDDLVVDGSASVRTASIDDADGRWFVVEWRNVHRAGNTSERITVEVMLHEAGFIFLNYAGLSATSDAERGSEATVGIESPGGTVGLQYSFLQPVLADGSAVVFLPPQIMANPIQMVTLAGTVTDAGTGSPQAGTAVTLEPAGISVTADAAGGYAFADIEAGSYTVSAVKGNHCGKVLNLDVDVYETADVDLPLRPLSDAYGNMCQAGPAAFTPANGTVLPLSGDDGKTQVTVPFPISLYGQSYTTAWVDIDGLVAFAPYTGIPWQATELPSLQEQTKPNAAVYAFWDDWVVDASASIRTTTLGTAPHRQFIVEWRNVHNWWEPTARVSFEAVFHEGGDIQVAWNDIDPGVAREQGAAGAVAIENADGTFALVHSYQQPVIASGQGVRFTPGPAPIGDITGTVTYAGTPAAGVSVKVAGLTATTAADGSYLFGDVPGGPYTVLATPGTGSGCYGTAAQPVTVSGNATSTVDFDLPASSGTRYTAVEGPRTFVPANDTVLPSSGDDGIQEVTLPFPVALYGQSYPTAWIANDGVIAFEAMTNQPYDPWPLPSEWESSHPNTAVYPFQHDWVLDASASIRTATTGTAPNRRFIVEWRNVYSLADPNARVSFEAVFHEQGDIEIVWDDIDVNFYEQGGEATVGVENADGTQAVQYGYRHPVIADGRGLLLHPVTS